MTIQTLSTQEVAALRAQSQKLIADAQAKAATIETQAQNLEATLTTLPAELGALAEGAAENVWNWIKGIA